MQIHHERVLETGYFGLVFVLLSDHGVGLFRTVFRLFIKATRTNYGLKGTYILLFRWFLPEGTADTDSIASLMQIWTTGWEHAPNLTADVTIVSIVHGRSVLQYEFLSAAILNS